MATLPLEFDTTAVWQGIVRNVQLGLAGLAAMIPLALVFGNVRGAVGLAVILLVAFVLVRRVRGVSMGAVGTLTAKDVTTRPVKVLWYSLPVPAGRFPIDQFQSIAVVEYTPQPGRVTRFMGSVELAGRPGTPNVRVAYQPIDSAVQFAQELAQLLELPFARVDAPGTRSFRMTV